MMGYRPRFDKWKCTFNLLLYSPEEFGEDKARLLVDDAGMKVGLLSFRPEKKGPFGRFKVECWKVT